MTLTEFPDTWRSREVRTFVCGFARKPYTEYQSIEAKDGPTALKGLNGEPKTVTYTASTDAGDLGNGGWSNGARLGCPSDCQGRSGAGAA